MSKDIYEKARERVNKKKKFHKDLTNYLVTCTILFFINVFIARGYMWSLWVIFFWGLGILKNAIEVYGFPFSGSDWEEREIQKEVERMKSLGEGNTESDFPDSNRPTEPVKEERESTDSRRERGWNEKDLV